MKIHEYDGENLIVSFSSDENKKTVDECQKLNFQPAISFPDVHDPEEIIKRIAFSGIYYCESEIKKEIARENQSLNDFYKSKVNQVLEFDVLNLQEEHFKKIHGVKKEELQEEEKNIINNIIIV